MSGGSFTTLEGIISPNRLRRINKTSPLKRRTIILPRSKYISDIVPRNFTNSLHPNHPLAQSRKSDISNTSNYIQQNSFPVQISSTSQARNFLPELPDTLKRNHQSNETVKKSNWLNSQNKTQLTLKILALFMVAAGVYVSWTSWNTNHLVKVQAARLTAQANKAASTTSNSGTSTSAISTIKPSASALANYEVAPPLPKYIKIPAINVNARVLQVGVLASGALGTPSNVYDAAWYTGSAQPGQPGATLIDGHVSSWTTEGVFYELHNLKPGDAIQIVKGDNTVINYKVVKSQVYSADNVDMKAAMTPVTPGISGLNLITCTGQVIKGSSDFNQRIIVFAQEV